MKSSEKQSKSVKAKSSVKKKPAKKVVVKSTKKKAVKAPVKKKTSQPKKVSKNPFGGGVWEKLAEAVEKESKKIQEASAGMTKEEFDKFLSEIGDQLKRADLNSHAKATIPTMEEAVKSAFDALEDLNRLDRELLGNVKLKYAFLITNAKSSDGKFPLTVFHSEAKDNVGVNIELVETVMHMKEEDVLVAFVAGEAELEEKKQGKKCTAIFVTSEDSLGNKKGSVEITKNTLTLSELKKIKDDPLSELYLGNKILNEFWKLRRNLVGKGTALDK